MNDKHCSSCGVEYQLYSDDCDAEQLCCPYCGEELVEELQFNE